MIWTPHLKGYWRFEGNANDSSGNGNHGTVHGALLTKGKFGQCYEFDGEDDYVEVSDDDSLDIDNDITLSAWIKTPSSPSHFFEKYYPSSDEGGYGLSVNDDGIFKMYGRTGSGYQSVESNVLVNDNEWHFVVGKRKGANWSVYVDGEFKNSETYDDNSFANSNPLIIGKYDFRDNLYLNGSIDEIQIYDIALSQSDIKRTMLGMHPLNG